MDGPSLREAEGKCSKRAGAAQPNKQPRNPTRKGSLVPSLNHVTDSSQNPAPGSNLTATSLVPTHDPERKSAASSPPS